MLKALLLDDEEDALDVLMILLNRHCPEVSTVDGFKNGEEALQTLRTRAYDIAFLDVQLQRGQNGLALAEALKDQPTRIVFVTAHEKYAVAAFKMRVHGYLLKPVDVDDLKQLVGEIVTERKPVLSFPTITLSDHRKQRIITEDQIMCAKGAGSYTTVYLADGSQIELSRGLARFEAMLQSNFFFRCHQSHLINVREFKRLVKKDGYFAELCNGTLIPVSRRARDRLLAFIHDFPRRC